MINEQIIKIFGIEINQQKRFESYDLLESFIENNVDSWDQAPDTDLLSQTFANELKKISNEELAFLILHSGYIPEFYLHDSSQETLYSKLIEVLVCEWAIRIGFKDSLVQKQKSNKEDITIQDGSNIIVCDAKSFRLGRSQAAPNVKDTIKKAAYVSWLQQYDQDSRVGGLITFPSLLDWQKASEAYKYFTEGEPPILFMFYEHCSLFIIKRIPHTKIINLMNSYKEVFPSASKDKSVYFKGYVDHLFQQVDFKNFINLSELIIRERVKHTIDKIDGHLIKTKVKIEAEVNSIALEKLQEQLVKSLFDNKCGQIIKQLENIKKFRPH